MGTHPIFESDFDCLTEQIMQRRIVTTSTRGIKSMWGHNTPSNTKVLTNNQKTLTQASLTRAKDDFVKGTKKSATLAYPEDALITHHAAAKAVSGVGDETEGRLVTISQTTRNVVQSADKNAQYWQIEFDTQERWENPTMGWGSTADPLSNTHGWMHFKTKEAAIDFAHRQGWEIDQVVEPRKKILEFREYGDNFAWNKRLRKPAK